MPNREEEKQRRPLREPPDLRALAKRLKDMEDARSRQMLIMFLILKMNKLLKSKNLLTAQHATP